MAIAGGDDRPLLTLDPSLLTEFDAFTAMFGEALAEARSQGNDVYMLGELLGGVLGFVERLVDITVGMSDALEYHRLDGR